MTDELTMRRRLRDDFNFFAAKCLRIRAKDGQVIPLRLNSAQRYVHEWLEKQKKQTGRVRAIILKGRQQGISTYVQARFYHQLIHARGMRAFILTHKDESTQTIFDMTDRYYRNSPSQVRPKLAASNAKELVFGKLDSGYRVATAGGKGTGRSDTIQYFHGSEVAFWPNAEDHAAGALQMVPGSGSEVILESTSVGPRGLFWKYWSDAIKGDSGYIPIFVPWFWQSEYQEQLPDDFELTAEEVEYKTKYEVTNEQLVWRRGKVRELFGVHRFRREYPATPEEAWSAEVPGALWSRKLIQQFRRDSHPEFVVGITSLDPSTTNTETSDAWGQIWGGRGTDGHVYVCGDDTLKATPLTAAKVAIRRLQDSDLDMVVYETNQGGDMVQTIINGVDPGVVCKGVRASKGKRARAEPVHALYEQGLVHHVGELPLLEDEMCTWDASRSNESPNRIDALVWLVTELLIKYKDIVLL
jgi:hypothetical protein